MRRRAMVLALLFVFAAVSPVAPAAAGSTSSVPAPVLGPGEGATTGLSQPGVHFSGAVTDQYVVLDVRYQRLTTQSAIEAADNGKRQAVLYRQALDRVESKLRELESRRRAARRGLANGSLDSTSAIRRMGHIAIQAEALTGAVLSLRRTAAQSRMGLTAPERASRLQNRSRSLETRLSALSGPVGLEIGAALAGHRNPPEVYIAATDVGVVLSTVTGTTYHRDAFRPDRRDDVSGTVDLLAARELVAERYPALWNASDTGTRRILALPNGAVLAELRYAGGSLTAAIDITNGAVFREQLALNLSAYDPGPVRVRRQGGYVLRVNRTYAGGPLRIALSDDRGRSVDGRVTVEGRFVGRTGPDGVIWTVAPGGRGDQRIILTAEVDGVQVPISVQLLDEV